LAKHAAGSVADNKYELETTERTNLIEVKMPLLENHLEQIMLSSNAIAELP
jgi:hypothetical protein